MKSLLLLLVSIFLTTFHANASCDFSPSSSTPASSTQYYSAPILSSITIAAPTGVPVGSTFYQQKIQVANFQATQLNCTDYGNFYYGYRYGSTPKSISTYSTKVYETGITGVGIKFIVNSTYEYPYIVPVSPCSNSNTCNPWPTWHYPTEFMLIKTSDNIVAGTINGGELPTIQYVFGHEDSLVVLQEVKLTGSITITTPTCNITTASQAMTIPMGQYDISEFTAKGTGTAWKDASIQLIGCGRFYGKASNSIATFDGTTTTTTGSLANNTWSLTLSPYSSIIDATKGIMDIDDNPLRANGVGIQLSTTQSTSGLINLNNAVTGTLPNDGSSNITVPLYARYIQTGNSVSAGKANGKLMYTITYQ